MPSRDTGLRIAGLTDLTRDLLAMGVDVADLKDAFAKIADEAARSAAHFAPVRSGRLRASIHGSRAKNSAKVSAGGGRVLYAGPINYGWPKRHIQASNFLQKASEEISPRVPGMLDTAIQKLIDERDMG